MIPAPLDRALDDARLSPFKVRVLGLLHRYLAYHEYREVKLYQLALRLGMDGKKGKGTISRVLRDLVACGYLGRGPDGGSPGRIVRTYILLWAPPPGCSPATLPAA